MPRLRDTLVRPRSNVGVLSRLRVGLAKPGWDAQLCGRGDLGIGRIPLYKLRCKYIRSGYLCRNRCNRPEVIQPLIIGNRALFSRGRPSYADLRTLQRRHARSDRSRQKDHTHAASIASRLLSYAVCAYYPDVRNITMLLPFDVSRGQGISSAPLMKRRSAVYNLDYAHVGPS